MQGVIMFNKSIFHKIIFVLFTFTASIVYAQDPTGHWVTIDDKTGKKKAEVLLSLSGDTLNGTIIKVYQHPDGKALCTKCPGSLKNKPFAGLQFLWGLTKKKDGVWEGGHILDPHTGKIYRAKVTMQANKLQVRGFMGFSLLGRTQVWVRP